MKTRPKTMKNTQMIHSPRTFKLGLGLILAAGLASMPVLTGASDRESGRTGVAKAESSKKLSSAKRKSTVAEPKAPKKKPRTTGRAQGASPKPSAEERARARILKLEGEAKKIAATLTPTQRTKLLALLNDAKPEDLTSIDGVGESRSVAIKEARPIKSIEDLPKVRGVGIKTLAGVVDHGKTLTRSRSKKSGSKTSRPEGESKTAPRTSASTAAKKKV